MAASSGNNVPEKKACQVAGKCLYSIWKQTFEIDEKYVPIKGIGKGAYGVVCSARNRVSGEKVAIKKISSAFSNEVDAIRTLREMNLLRGVNHDNVIKIKDIMKPLSREKFQDVYIVYECMDTDLHQIIRSPQPLSDDHFQYFIWQVLRGLKYLHSADIIHRDLKPSNLLLNADCDLKICDFGLARSSNKRVDMTKYVVTRWYRAPELLLACQYSTAIDMWSVGCILGELLGRKPLFQGSDYIQTLRKIVEILGPPTDEDLSFIEMPRGKLFIKSIRAPEGKVPLASRFPDANELAVDLLEQLLQFDPCKRPTAEEALNHPWLASLHEEDEPSAKEVFRYDFEEEHLTTQDIRDLVYKEVMYWQEKNNLQPRKAQHEDIPSKSDLMRHEPERPSSTTA